MSALDNLYYYGKCHLNAWVYHFRPQISYFSIHSDPNGGDGEYLFEGQYCVPLVRTFAERNLQVDVALSQLYLLMQEMRPYLFQRNA
jgi:hypothetical protein